MNQPGLFDLMQDATIAKQARDAGIKQVIENENMEWREKCDAFLKEFLRDHRSFIGEDFRVWAMNNGLPKPHHHNVWGHILPNAARRGLVLKTDRARQTSTEKSHARDSMIWVAR